MQIPVRGPWRNEYQNRTQHYLYQQHHAHTSSISFAST